MLPLLVLSLGLEIFTSQQGVGFTGICTCLIILLYLENLTTTIEIKKLLERKED